MRNTKILSLMTATLLLSGCAGMFGQHEVDALNKAAPAGDAFTAALTSEYRELANSEWNEMDWRDGQHFARKGLKAAGGEAVAPDAVGSRHIPAAAMDDLSAASSLLSEKLAGGAREHKPEIAAKAQASYDCWLEQQEENHQPDDIAACRKSFEAAVAQLGSRYMVFFDTGSAHLTQAAGKIVHQAVKDAKAAGFKEYVVVGHTDTVGSAKSNDSLSKRRAAAVKAALIARGVPAKKIVIAGKGEAAPSTPTADGVKEPTNRRAEIVIQ